MFCLNCILILFNFKKCLLYGFSVLFCFMCFWYVVKSYVLCYLIVLCYVGKCFIVNINVNTSSMAHAFKITSVVGRSYEFWNVCSRIMDHTYNYPFSKCFYLKLNETAIHLEEKPLVIRYERGGNLLCVLSSSACHKGSVMFKYARLGRRLTPSSCFSVHPAIFMRRYI